MKRNDYDGDGPPDLSHELEAADKIILNQDKEIEHLRQQLAGGAFIARMVGAIERQRPLCPDHRDKQIGKPCPACTVETLERNLAEARSLLREVLDSIDRAVAEYDDGSWYLARVPDVVNLEWHKRAIIAVAVAEKEATRETK
jgi:hypothetical protein